jgi:putative membrane-bound dehydrogenase-like protein
LTRVAVSEYRILYPLEGRQTSTRHQATHHERLQGLGIVKHNVLSFKSGAAALILAALAAATAAAQNPPRESPVRQTLNRVAEGVRQLVRPQQSGRVKALFLGDNGHHVPYVRAKEALPVLASGGIDLFYTDQPSDLNETELSQYHVLVLYNNHTNVTRPQLNALLSFVENGGGLVVLHCASASFQNSEEFIRLVGAAFKSHGMATFRAPATQPNHPVMRGVPDFQAEEETYIHTKHNPNRTVLAVRKEGNHEEPWTWVRNYGKGRVFYTAWGHDQRTWSQAGFRTLLTNAVKWTAGDWAMAAQKAAEPSPAIVKLPVPMPVYRQDTAWNNLAKKHVETASVALPAAESFKLMTLRPGFRVELFAAEPLINNIIDFTWDARGRMWAIETIDYPNDVLPDSVPGHDSVVILEDTNGDGRADKRTVFATGMNLATSLVLANGGVIVAQAPHILFFKDTNGDGKSDSRQILFSGWPRGDTHGTPSNFRWGFDNQIWGSVGYNGFQGTVGGTTFERGQFGAGYFRFPVDGKALDYVARTSNNTWGFAFSEDGNMFGSTANSQPSAFVHIPGRYYRSIGVNNPVLPRIHDRNDIYPLREVQQVDQFGRYTAGAAHEMYTARAFPKEYWNRIGFVVEPTGHLVGMFEMIPNGSGFIAKNRWNLMASRDEWIAPVQVKVGPDGAVWVSDFYTLIAQHNPTPRAGDPTVDSNRFFTKECCETGKGAAYETPNRDKVHGRIYRIVYEKAPRATLTRLDNASPAQLVSALSNDNMFWRMTAQQRLVERKQTDVVPALIRLVNNQTVDELGLNPGALHALWTLHGLGAITSNTEARNAARGALNHPAASLRRAALQMLPRDNQLLEDIFAAGLLPDRTSPTTVSYTVGANVLQDADPQVRLTALLTLSELPASPRAATSILDLIFSPQNARDPWLPDAAAIAGAKQGPTFLSDFLQRRMPNDSAALAGLRNSAVMMTRSFATNGQLEPVYHALLALPRTNVAVANAVLNAIAPPAPPEGRGGGGGGGGQRPGWPQDRPPSLSAEQLAAIKEAVRTAPAELAEGYARVGVRWGMPDAFARGQ